MLTITGVAGVRARVGEDLGVSPWLEVDQRLVDRFAETTHDHQWIHVDPARAAASPFGGTIAHGLLVLSLGPRFTHETYAIEGFAFGLNYGYDRVRFPSPLPAGRPLRMRSTLVAADDVPGGVQTTVRQTFEARGAEKPVCVADAIGRWIV